jgi:hypothetical protein
LPPYVYEERQHAAPEALTIKVISAKISHNETREAVIRGVVAKAEIISVEHSATWDRSGNASPAAAARGMIWLAKHDANKHNDMHPLCPASPHD